MSALYIMLIILLKLADGNVSTIHNVKLNDNVLLSDGNISCTYNVMLNGGNVSSIRNVMQVLSLETKLVCT